MAKKQPAPEQFYILEYSKRGKDYSIAVSNPEWYITQEDIMFYSLYKAIAVRHSIYDTFKYIKGEKIRQPIQYDSVKFKS